MKISRDNRLKFLCLHDECSHHIRVNLESVVSLRSSQGLVNGSDVTSKCNILISIDLIQQEEKQIETREECSWQVNVLMGLQFDVVSAIERVSSSED